MIGRLSGTLIHRAFDDVIIDVQGVGYAVSVSVRTLQQLPAIDEPATLWVHTNVREDAIELYGFASTAERDIFRQMLNVSGVGSRTALAAISEFSPTELFEAITTHDIKALSRISGVGKKTAQRIILDLADSIELDGAEAAASPGARVGASGPWAQLQAALEELGYRHQDIQRTIGTLEDGENEDETVQTLLKEALRLLRS